MESLGFRLLDRHVVDGRADHIAVETDGARISYADLLERIAALAGALRHVGVTPGVDVSVSTSDERNGLLAVLACIRLGAYPGVQGDVRIEDDPEGTVVRAGEHTHTWKTVMKAGGSDPAPSLETDPEGFEERLRTSHAELLDIVLAGETVTLPE